MATDEAELVEVRRSRARMLDQHEAERRRIERDLHDGAQQRLTSLAMLLGLATIQLGHDGQLGHDSEQDSPAWLVARAHDEAKLALAELQELIRGIHPKVLTDRGLDAALGELVDRCAIPVHLDTVVGRRLSDLTESAAYYAVSEALTNVVKHSGAARAEVIARYTHGTLCVEIRDDGRGGADRATVTVSPAWPTARWPWVGRWPSPARRADPPCSASASRVCRGRAWTTRVPGSERANAARTAPANRVGRGLRAAA